MERSAEGAAVLGCTACGSTRVGWRVRRLPGASGKRGRQTLLWTCRECGAGWEEPMRLPETAEDPGS